jgi:hypothetical protein
MPAFSRSTRFLVYFLDSLQEASRDVNSDQDLTIEQSVCSGALAPSAYTTLSIF